MDLNCDLGESLELLASGHDEALMHFIDSANIACGFHAGDPYITRKTVENARKYRLRLGAHPGFDDRANFGRKDTELSEEELKRLIRMQLEYFRKFAGEIHHVKPHGALYNMSARRQDYARIIAEEVYRFDPEIVLYGLAGSLSILEAKKVGLKTCPEAFADRAYLSDGSLAPRGREGAVLRDKEAIVRQVRHLAMGLPLETLDGPPLLLHAETVCVHSDTPQAVEIAQWTREQLEIV